MKICTKCKRELDESCFSKRGDTKDGLSYVCKECKRQYDKKKYDEKLRNIICTDVKQTNCAECGKIIQEVTQINNMLAITKFCSDCFPNQMFKTRTCKSCGKLFKVGRKPTQRNNYILRDYCPDCDVTYKETKELVCPKCGKTYTVTRTPDGRHF